jgi:8-amino-3,8-dideoxy-alpha-D-manno-octulosonate transaminase
LEVKMPGPGSYLFGKEEIEQVMDVLNSGYLFRYGQLDDNQFKHKVFDFEKEFAEYTHVPYALATSSGTSALLVSLLAMGLKPGDHIMVPAYTFVASFTSIIYAGCTPILTEIDNSLNIDPDDIRKRITSRTKAIQPVHMLGNPANMDEIMDIADEYGLKVLEDACQACGASYKGKKLGTIGDMGAFSLNIFKTIMAGDGGVVITRDKDLYERAFAYHDQGHSPNRAGVEVGHRNILGLNFRINELSGAVALAQLRKLDHIMAELHKKKQKLKKMISDIDGCQFRTLNDEKGECATILTVIFNSPNRAARVSAELNTTTVDHSGWHVYSNMEHLNQYLQEKNLPYGKGAYPKTDNVLSRSINISIGVVDAGLGAGFGISIESTDNDIEQAAERFRTACKNNP